MKQEICTGLGRVEFSLDPRQQQKYKEISKAIKRDFLRVGLYDCLGSGKQLAERGMVTKAKARNVELDLTKAYVQVTKTMLESVPVTFKTYTNREVGVQGFVRYASYCEHQARYIETKRKYDYFLNDMANCGSRVIYDLAGVIDDELCAATVLSAANGALGTKTWPLTFYFYSRTNMAVITSVILASINGMVDWEKCRINDTPDELTPDERLEAAFIWWELRRGSIKPLLKAIKFMCSDFETPDMWREEKKQLSLFASESSKLLDSFLEFFGLPKSMGKYSEVTHPVAKAIIDKYGDKYSGLLMVMCDEVGPFPFGYMHVRGELSTDRNVNVCSLGKMLGVEVPQEYTDKILDEFIQDYKETADRMYNGVATRLDKEQEKTEAAERERDKTSEKMEGLREVNRKQKADLKKAVKDRDELAAQVNRLKKKLETQDKILRSGGLSDKGFDELQAAKDKVRELQSKMDSLTAENTGLTREIKKKQLELEDIQEELGAAQEQNGSLARKLEAAEDIVLKHNAIQGIAKIPLECYIEAIKPYKLVLVGGEKCHSQLNQWGLDIKTLGPRTAKLRNQDISGADLVIFMTVQIGHSSVYSYKSTADNCGVPTMYCNAHTADDVILEVFSWINNPANSDILRKRK